MSLRLSRNPSAILSNSSTVRQGPRYIRSTTLRRPRRAVGDGVRRMHEARDVEVVRHHEQLAVRVLHEAHVVERPDRHVGVADHVFEQHRPRQRVGFEIGERDALQVDDPAFVTPRDVVFVLDEEGVAGIALLQRPFFDVGRAGEPRPERQRRQHVVDRVGQVLAQRVLLELLRRLAAGAELQRRSAHRTPCPRSLPSRTRSGAGRRCSCAPCGGSVRARSA